MFEPSSNLLQGMVESVQLNPNGILYAKIRADEIADEISLMETRVGSAKARTTTSSKIGPCIGPPESWEEVIKEEVGQLEANVLVWIVDENVKRAH